MNRNWLMVFIAGLFEIAWVIGLKHSNSLIGWLGTIIAILISMDLLIRASKRLPVGTTYAVFTGIGTSGTVIMEMLVFGEPFKIAKLLLILLLISGVIGLKMITGKTSAKEVQ
ncbi:DMT family transporter [Paenibacillus allorhizosphaerae]|uniref:Guanidinium efflux system subunit GdnC n=1 Tax=Paenibacillus allorhizosphaerae TaxID=2849866 RepID=A0ABN7TVF3_9BACL|nr:multidrug efflux SMR transporter [Paenibacillus allorhizosphaerae]CAG7657350.1 putative guanidinium efflux system subunit GdnC [Paenibacillus allorhizosphaerae]